jgi:hypothetical protein
LGSGRMVKRHRKNVFTHHLTPHTTLPVHHENTTTIFEMGPTIAVGSVTLQNVTQWRTA